MMARRQMILTVLPNLLPKQRVLAWGTAASPKLPVPASKHSQT